MMLEIWVECESQLEGFKLSNPFLFQKTLISWGYGMLQEIFTILTEAVLLCKKEFKIHGQTEHYQM